MKTMWFLKKIDIFGQNVKLLFNSQRKFPSILGGIFTICVIIIVLVSIINLGKEIVYKTEPKLNVMNLFTVNSPLIELNPSSLLFAFQVIDRDYMPFYDESYFTFNLYNFVVNRTLPESSMFKNNPLNLINCTEYFDYFANQETSYRKYNFSNNFNSNNLNEAFCIENLNAQIGGNFITDYFSNIRFSINRCNNSTSKVQCKSREEINEKIRGAFFEFYFIDKYIDSADFKDPFIKYFNQYFILLDDYYKFIDIFFTNTTINSDAGFLTPNKQNKTVVKFDYYREQFNTYEKDLILDFYINSSKNMIYITRIYMKLQDLFATVGGIISICLVIGKHLSLYLNKYKMYEIILNTLYNFNSDNNESDIIVYNKQKNEHFRNSFKIFNTNKKQLDFKNRSTKVKKDCKNFQNTENNLSEDSREANVSKVSNLNGGVGKDKIILTETNNKKSIETFNNKDRITNMLKENENNNFELFEINEAKENNNLEDDNEPSDNVIIEADANEENNIPSGFISERVKNENVSVDHENNSNIVDNIAPDKAISVDFKDIKKRSIDLATEGSENSRSVAKKFNHKTMYKYDTFDNILRNKYKSENSSPSEVDFKRSSFKKQTIKNMNSEDRLQSERAFTLFEEKMQMKEGILHISYLKIFHTLFCKFCIKKAKNRHNSLEKCYNDMKKYLDYIDIIKLLQEFTKLKIILLSQSQVKIFSQISKPKINFNSQNDMVNDYLHGKIFENPKFSMNELYDAFVKLSDRKDSVIDSRLISLMDDDMRNLFNTIGNLT